MATALNDTHMEEGVARAIAQRDEAKTLVRVVPFDGRPDRRTRGAVKLWTARRWISEIASRRLIAVIVETTATGGTKISVYCSRDFLGWIEHSAI